MKMALYRVSAGFLASLVLALLPACKSMEVPKVPGITPYRMVIQQGNFISQEMVAQLKPGMSKEQVRFILGTPLVTDIFHADRWDYVFYREMPDGKREQRNLSVVFEKEKLVRVLGDLMPAEGAAPQASGFPPLAKPETKPEAKPETAAKPADKPAAAALRPPPEGDQPAAKPVAETPKPAAEAPKPAAEAPQPAAEAPTAADEKKEPGFFDRLREKIGL